MGTVPAASPLLGGQSTAAGGVEEEVLTGEEDEQTLWSGDGTLFEFGPSGWKERGRGQARVKVAACGGRPVVDPSHLAIEKVVAAADDHCGHVRQC